jgi:hypothetical protein
LVCLAVPFFLAIVTFVAQRTVHPNTSKALERALVIHPAQFLELSLQTKWAAED